MRSELAKRHKTHTSDQVAEQTLQESTELKTYVQKAIAGTISQKKAIDEIQQQANRDADQAMADAQKASQNSALAAEKVIKCRVQAQKLCVMSPFRTVKSGVKKTRANGYFFVERNGQQHIYHMSPTGRSAKKSTPADAKKQGWILPAMMKTVEQKVMDATAAFQECKLRERKQADMAEQKTTIAKHIKKVATTTIQTTKGVQAEDKDLQQVQRSQPSVRQGNRKAYFYSIFGRPFGAFIIGYIDGFDTETGTVIELKHRSRGLFRELREYEKIQCFVYMKMLKVKRAKLIETYDGEQQEYVIEWDASIWRRIEKCIVQVVCDLNRAEEDVDFRNTLIETLV